MQGNALGRSDSDTSSPCGCQKNTRSIAVALNNVQSCLKAIVDVWFPPRHGSYRAIVVVAIIIVTIGSHFLRASYIEPSGENAWRLADECREFSILCLRVIRWFSGGCFIILLQLHRALSTGSLCFRVL